MVWIVGSTSKIPWFSHPSQLRQLRQVCQVTGLSPCSPTSGAPGASWKSAGAAASSGRRGTGRPRLCWTMAWFQRRRASEDRENCITYSHYVRCTSMYINVHQCTSMYINVHQCTSMYINVHQCTSIYAFYRWRKIDQIGSNQITLDFIDQIAGCFR